jgi:spoIIIJ-associated protein
VSFFGENIAVEARVEDDMITLAVESSDLNSILIGRNAETLRSLQYIVMTALHNKGAALTHVIVDVANYKKQREEKIAEKARGWIEEVRRSGDSHIAHINAANKKYTFRSSSGNVKREIVLFTIVTLFGLWVLQNGVIWLISPLCAALLHNESLALLAAKLAGTIVSLTWNYLTYDILVFRKDIT